VTTKGNLALTRSLRRVESTTEGFLWSLAADGQGGLYAGTGTQGRVLHLDSAGKSRVLADLPEINVHAVLAAPDGTVWAATAPNGRVYKITPDGKYTVAYEAPEKYALALARDSKGAIYVGTGGGTGRIYRIGTDGKAAKFYETSVQHVLALTVDRNDNLYAGTSTEGLIYKVTPEGKGSVVYDSPQASITAVGVNDTGDLFAATAPQGVVYRITPAGAVTTLVERAPAALTTLAVGPRNTVYAGGGNTVYAISPDGTVSSLENRTDVDILALAVNRSGTLFVGTGNVAEVYAADPAGTRGSGAYESAVHDAKQTANWGSIRWNAVVPRGSNLRIETRSGNVAEPDTTWSEWQPVQAGAGSSRVASPPARFLQYRILLDSDEYGESPSLRDIAVTYLPQNQAPRVTFQAPAGGEQWAGRQSLKWNATDPDKDTLSYTVFYSADFGKTWNPLPSGGTVKSAPAGGTAAPGVPMGGVPDPTAAPGSVESRLPLGTGAPSLEQVKAELDRHPDMPAALRQAILDRAGRAAQPGQQSPQPGSVAAAPTRAATLNLDTKTLPDGVYILKVVASDAPSNPQDAQTAEAVSEAFTVANAPPVLVLYKTALKTESNRSVVLEGAALQPLIAVSAVQYRVDNGEWVSAVPGDGIFDSSLENFRIATEPLSPGSHTIEVKAFSAASLVASEKITVEVK
jgi:sugar lactone lactonase YvrE